MSKPEVTYLTDKLLVKAVLAGDASAFRRFFDENYDRLFRFVLPLLDGNHHAAEEVVQESMSKALKKLDTYRGEAQLYTWLCRVGRNQAIDWRRSNQRHADASVSLDDDVVAQKEVAVQPDQQVHGPEASAERTERSAQVHGVLDALPPKYGDVLEYKYMYGMTAKEISTRMGIGVEAVNSTLARAKRAFRDAYTEAGREASGFDAEVEIS